MPLVFISYFAITIDAMIDSRSRTRLYPEASWWKRVMLWMSLVDVRPYDSSVVLTALKMSAIEGWEELTSNVPDTPHRRCWTNGPCCLMGQDLSQFVETPQTKFDRCQSSRPTMKSSPDALGFFRALYNYLHSLATDQIKTTNIVICPEH